MTKIFFSALLSAVLIAAGILPAEAWTHGSAAGSIFNNGKYQAHLNFTSIGGDYPFINELKNVPNWSYQDNSGTPDPDALDANGYPIPGSAVFSHGGVYALMRVPDVSYAGNARVIRTTGKGTPSFVGGTVATLAGATVNVSGSATTLTLAGTPTYAFRGGQEIPISGVTGVTASNGGGGNLTAGGTTGAWTICASYNGVSLTVPLCLNDQVTPLQTTGTAVGTATLSYGRFAVGVATNGRVLVTFPSAPVSINVGITATDAVTPISDMAIMRPDREALWDACTLPGKACFNPDVISLLNSGSKAAWMRDLNQETAPSGNSMTGQVDWASRKPVGYFSYGSQHAMASRYAGSTTSSSAGVSTGNDYQLTFGSGAPTAGQQILFKFNADAVTITTGTPAQLNWTNHNLVVGQPFNLFYTVAPTTGGAPSTIPNGPTNLFVASVVDPNTITFAATVGGTAINATSTGSNVVAHATVVKSTTVTVTGAPTTNVNWPAHLLTVNEPVTCNNPPAPLYTPQKLYIKTVTDANNVTFSSTPGGTAITITANQSNFQCIREPTLNLNGTGAVPIRGIEGTGISVSTRTNTPQYASGFTSVSPVVVHAALVYDSVIGAWLKMGGDAGLTNQYIANFWPPEIFLEFTKQVGAHPWYVSPMYALDPATDWLPELMNYVKNNKASWQTPAFETDNEDWNNAFYGTAYANNHGLMYKATAGWATGSGYNYVGKIGSIIGQTAASIFGTHLDSSVYQVIVGLKTGDFTSTSAPTTAAPRNTAAEYVAQSTSPQSLVWSGGTINYAKDAAYKWATHNANAQYWSPSYYYSNSLRASLGASFAAGRIRQATIDSVGNGTGAAGNIMNVTQTNSGGVNNIDVGTQLFAPGITSNGITSSLTVTKMSPTAGCGGTCTGTGGLGTYEVSGNVLVGSSGTPAIINFIPSTSSTSAIQTFIDSSPYSATFTATLTNGSNSMVVTGVTGTITVSATGLGTFADFLMDPSGANPTLIQISSQASGTTGSDGTYTLSKNWTAATTTTAMRSAAQFSMGGVKAVYVAAQAFAASYCNGNGTCVAPGSYPLRMRGYEGGYSPDLGSNTTPSQTDSMFAFGKLVSSTPNSANGVEGYVTTNCNNFHAAGGEYCSLFQLSGVGPSGDDWSALPDIYVPNGSSYFNGYKNLPFLLKRDVDPASNDNDPMWLEKAA